MRIILLATTLLALGVVTGLADIRLSADVFDPVVTGHDIELAHKKQWKSDSVLFKTCPTCILDQPFPEDS